ncbi:hypothetical protein PHLGIDRAFT_127453 [Phlebiopsis gigantea 11061_1 CR5-6]|uniref:Uncharacterized protein n=1 Tax=Phlebiopsis gigantea (strain 11061_1 CR5-6) TaxID=745531 RepID=A0A0C3SB65_PHLG1|nr:hypothetical protein PHLGIDRAFT_127453 [Phlebiopsis gigantea 11061_1 CR5-6]
MADSGLPSSYACKCLNVRIHPAPPPRPPQKPLEPSFTPVYVGEHDINITHIQLTLRHKGSPTQSKTTEGTQPVRIVSLTCLICQTLVYRISQVSLPDVESGEGPVLPTDDWVEKEILKSTDGWIEVSADALTGNSVTDAESSPQYSKIFGILLPVAEVSTNTADQAQTFLSPPQSVRPSSPTLPESILPHLSELFPPPPFTPTHPVFVHLSSLATAESEKLRASAEEHLRKVLQEKISEVQAAETKLKQDVERIWDNFKHVVQKLEGGDVTLPRIGLRTRRSSSRGRGPTASVRVIDFVPTPSPPARQTSRAAAPAHSALSASLATSTLQNAMWQRGRSRSPGASNRSPARTIRPDSPSTASSKTLGMPINGEAEIREAHRRNMDESVDMATSFKYMMDIGAHIEAARIPPAVQEEADEDEAQADVPSPSTSAVPRGRSPRAGKSAIKKAKPNGDVDAVKEAGSPVRNGTDNSPPKETTTPTKGKRKVTFDVKPDVAIISTAPSKPSSSKGDVPEGTSIRIVSAPSAVLTHASAAEVFDMEGEMLGDELETPGPVAASQPDLPVQEPIRLARRPNRFRHSSGSGLPTSLSSLRPASLPAPSAMRRVVAIDSIDDRARAQNVRDAVLASLPEADSKRRDVDEDVREFSEEADDEPTDVRETEILRLVAASMPSHRSAWKKDGAAWRTFVNRQKAQTRTIPEEDESSAAEGSAYYDESTDSSGPDEETRADNWADDAGLGKSLPIPIGPLGSRRVNGQAKQGATMDKVSAAAMRRASYAERDRMRMVDPGALDFDVDDEEDEPPNFTEDDTQVGGKSMQLALNILQKHSEIPGAGMWRSLA